MGEFADAMEQATPAADTSAPDTSAVPADSGSDPSPSLGSSSPDLAPSVPGRSTPAPTSGAPPGKAGAPAAKPSGAPGAAPDARMVPAPALTEARQQTKALRDTYGWLPKDHVPAIRGFYESFQRDPVGAVVDQLKQMLEHPVYAQQLQAIAGQAQQDHEPQPDYRDPETGDYAYSAQQAARWREWHAKQDRQRYSAELTPLKQYVQTQQQRERLATIQAEAQKRAKELFAPLRADPHFSEHQDKIKERFQQYAGTMPGEAALYRAYSEIMREVVMPTLGRTERSALARSLSAKTGASPNPARFGSSGAPTRRPADFREAAERLFGQ